MGKHTPEPWFVVYEPVGDPDAGIEGYEPSGEFVSGTPDSSVYVRLYGEDSLRIVACVNACAGIPTEQLTQGCVETLVDALEEIEDLPGERLDECPWIARKALEALKKEYD